MAYYKAHVFCCSNVRPFGHERGCCKEKGADKLRNYMKARVKELGLDHDIRINNSGCLHRCEMGPTMVIYPEGVWYSPYTVDDVEEIIQSHLLGGEPVGRLQLADDQTELRPDQKNARQQPPQGA